MTASPLELHLDDVVRLRKPHPCGAFEWTVVRLGADIGLRCHGCDHRVLLPRRTLEKRLKAFVRRGPGFAEPQPPDSSNDLRHQPPNPAANLDPHPGGPR
jgi:hypothetical protein